jgi:hypothetical protein
MIYIHNVKKSRIRLSKEYDNSIVIDVSSQSEMPYIKLSPFFPHGEIPVPFSKGITSQTVEGIWQGLKVFENHDIDMRKFEISSMSGIKRPRRFFGEPKGHRKGVNGDLIDYLSARKLIYIPTYLWVLKNKVSDIIFEIQAMAKAKDIILLDYTTNEDIEDLTTPLSHASLIKQQLIENDVSLLNNRFSTNMSSGDKNNKQTEINFDD